MFGFPLTTAAALLALATAIVAGGMTFAGFRSIDRPPGRWPLAGALVAGLVAGLFCLSIGHFQGQLTDEVRPTDFWRDFRVIYHGILLALLVAATCTDLDDYYIPDIITLPGMAIGVLLAGASGDLQMAHVWVDWNEAIPQIRGPYLPDWLSEHPHLHGLAWSLFGLATGMALTASVRWIAGMVMGKEALGFGDVLLMGMVGSFLGWQPTIVAFLIAPLCAITIAVLVRLVGGKTFIPYGPYLAAASVIVLFAWRWIWMFEFRLHAAAGPNDREGVFALRRLFGDWLSLVAMIAIMVVGLVVLLGLGQLYRLIPGRQAETHPPHSSTTDP